MKMQKEESKPYEENTVPKKNTPPSLCEGDIFEQEGEKKHKAKGQRCNADGMQCGIELEFRRGRNKKKSTQIDGMNRLSTPPCKKDTPNRTDMRKI